MNDYDAITALHPWALPPVGTPPAGCFLRSEKAESVEGLLVFWVEEGGRSKGIRGVAGGEGGRGVGSGGGGQEAREAREMGRGLL